MTQEQPTSIELHAVPEDIVSAYSFVENLLEEKLISQEIASDTLQVIEALLQSIIDQEFDEDTVLNISSQKTLGDITITIGFEGKIFSPFDDSGEMSLEGRILQAYDDKIDYSYRLGYNTISISVRRRYRQAIIFNTLGALAAIVVYGVLQGLALHDSDTTKTILSEYIQPIEVLIANAVLMVGTPVTFFSLLKNLTDTYIVAKRDSKVRHLQLLSLITSVGATLLALGFGLFLSLFIQGEDGVYAIRSGTGLSQTFSDVVTGLVPSNIFEPFETISPFPLIAVALLVTYAFCSIGKYFDTMKTAIDACYALFSRMLRVVMATLPFFCFIALLDLLIREGFIIFAYFLGSSCIVILGLGILLATYLIRLRTKGIRAIPFLKKLRPLLIENVKINSAIEATPFNIRYCSRNLGMSRKHLENTLPVLAQINLDGNCFIIMLVTMLFIHASGTPVTWLNIGMIALLVLVLSFGAPNQPGSILIGILIITTYLNTYDMLTTAIFAEALFGILQNLSNIFGDIVNAVIEEKDITKIKNSLAAN